MNHLASPTGPLYILPKALCDKYANGAIIDDIAELEGAGTGPYKVVTYMPDKEIKLERYEGYVPTMNDVGGQAAPKMAYVDTMTFAVNGDQASRTAGLIAGDYSIGDVMASMTAYAEQIGLKRDLLHNQWTHAIFFNLNEANSDSIVNNKDFRKAIRACLDMNAIALSVFQGEPRYELNSSPIAKTNNSKIPIN